MKPRIMKSQLTNPPQWYVVTRYREKRGVDAVTGEERHWLVASQKYEVTDQMEAILRDALAIEALSGKEVPKSPANSLPSAATGSPERSSDGK